MQKQDTDKETFVQLSWLWTPVALLATVILMVVTVAVTPVVFIVAQLSLPRSIKPLPDA